MGCSQEVKTVVALEAAISETSLPGADYCVAAALTAIFLTVSASAELREPKNAQA